MFILLSRIGRLLVGIPLVIGVTAIVGYGTFIAVPVASRHQAPSSSACSTAGTGVGQALVVSGHGFAPNSQYLLFLSTPAGTGATTATTDSSGSFSVSSWATWSGSYGATVWTEGGGSKQVATCTPVTV